MTALAAATATESVLQAVRGWVDTVCTDLDSAKIVVEPYTGTRPALPYASVMPIIGSRAVGEDWSQMDGTGASGTGPWGGHVYGQRETTMQVSLYGPGSLSRGESLRVGMRNPTATRAAAAAGVVIANVLDVRNLSVEVDGTWEERCDVDITVRYHVLQAFTDGVIESVTADVVAE